MQSDQPEAQSESKVPSLRKGTDFSLVAGGLLYQLLRRARLSGNALELVWRRVFVLVLLIWLPLLLLTVIEGHAWDKGLVLPFLKDIETHLRLLIAAPLLILAEVRVNRRFPMIVQAFTRNGLIPDDARPRFDAAIQSAVRMRDSLVPELGIIVFVYAVGIPFVWRDQFTLQITSWYATSTDGRLTPSFAGWWLCLVSMPLLQFLILRWLFRLAIWTRFLWQVTRIRLALEPAHPDGVAGLHFLVPGRALAFVSAAAGTMVCGVLANKILYTGARLIDFKVEIVCAVAVQAVIILGPLVLFYPQMRESRRAGLIEFGELGQDYAREFRRKWTLGARQNTEPLLGSPDLQSLADFHNSFEVVQHIPWVPFTTKNVLFVAVTTLLPMTPLLLTTFSVAELVDRMLKVML